MSCPECATTPELALVLLQSDRKSLADAASVLLVVLLAGTRLSPGIVIFHILEDEIERSVLALSQERGQCFLPDLGPQVRWRN